jgi:hypothetical protein
VSVRIGDKERTVGVGARKGEAAARRVALALVDLALAEANPEAGAARRPAPPAAPPIARPIEVPPFTGRLVVRLAPVVGVGTNGDQVHAGGALAASIKIVRWLRAFLEVQAGGGPSAQVGPVSVALAEVPLRLGLGARVWRLIEVRAALVVEPYRLAADGAPSESGALVGGGVSAEGYVPLARRVALAIGVGADLLANRLAWTVGGQPALATERAQFWIGVGVAAEALQ